MLHSLRLSLRLPLSDLLNHAAIESLNPVIRGPHYSHSCKQGYGSINGDRDTIAPEGSKHKQTDKSTKNETEKNS